MKPIIIYLIGFILIVFCLIIVKPFPKVISLQGFIPQPSSTPKALKVIDHYQPPKIAAAPAYTLIFVGDSMTESLGENFDALRPDLKTYYPNKIFGLFNYGFGSTNILTIEDRFNNETVYQGKTLPAILARGFDIIIIESFGNNPLSEYPLEQGLALQTKTLDHLVAELVDTKPNSLIIFLATIAPSQSLYGKGAVDLSPAVRNQWANERRAYIENHINYAKNHNIPLINIYEKSMDKNGLALTKYLNHDNYIHPSNEGVQLISQSIADYFYQNDILP
jgi:lysophospholipase L1-like esterase